MIKGFFTIAVDFDGVLVRHDVWRGLEHFGEIIPGAKEYLKKLREDGFKIIIHTCRTNTQLNSAFSLARMHLILKEFLDANGFEYDEIWMGIGKPVAHLYIDDRGMYFNGNWESAYKKITEVFV